jgi:hypothetical protein
MKPIHLALFVAAGCLSNATPLAAAATPSDTASKTGEWVTLFDGGATDLWRGFRRDHFPADGWSVEGDALTPLTDGTVIDLITRRQYRDYELELEWRVAPRGNSGLFVHVTEEHPHVWHTGPEIQLLDDEQHPDGQEPRTSAGSIFDLLAPQDKVLRPAGDYNLARLVVRGPHIVHYLNGRKILDFDLTSPEFQRLVAESKFAEMPDFARRHGGHIALQHASVSPLKAPVWFRNIRIRELPELRSSEPGAGAETSATPN